MLHILGKSAIPTRYFVRCFSQMSSVCLYLPLTWTFHPVCFFSSWSWSDLFPGFISSTVNTLWFAVRLFFSLLTCKLEYTISFHVAKWNIFCFWYFKILPAPWCCCCHLCWCPWCSACWCEQRWPTHHSFLAATPFSCKEESKENSSACCFCTQLVTD